MLLGWMTVVSFAFARTAPAAEVRPTELAAEAVRVADSIDDQENKARVLWRAAVVQDKLGDHPRSLQSVKQAIEASEKIQDVYHRMNVLINIADTQVKIGDNKGAKATLERALIVAGNNYGAISLVAQALADGSDRVAANKAFEKAIQNVGPVARIEKLVSIAERQQAAKDGRGAEATLKMAQDSLTGESDTGERVKGLRDIGSVQAASDPVGGMKLLKDALDLANSIDNKDHRIGARINILVAMAGAQSKKGDHVSAVATIRQALQESEALSDDETKTWALSGISIAAVKLGDLKTASEIRNRIDDHWGRNDTLLPTVDAQLEAGDIAGALETAKSIDDHDFLRKDIALGRVAAKQAESGDVAGALKSFEPIQTEPVKSVTLAAILTGQVKRGNAQTAVQTAMARTSPVERAIALLAIANTLVDQTPLP